MEIGIDSFAILPLGTQPADQRLAAAERMEQLLTEIETADCVGLDIFGIGEHHRAEFLDSAPALILAAAAARDKIDPPHQRRHRTWRSRSRARLPAIRNP